MWWIMEYGMYISDTYHRWPDLILLNSSHAFPYSQSMHLTTETEHLFTGHWINSTILSQAGHCRWMELWLALDVENLIDNWRSSRKDEICFDWSNFKIYITLDDLKRPKSVFYVAHLFSYAGSYVCERPNKCVQTYIVLLWNLMTTLFTRIPNCFDYLAFKFQNKSNSIKIKNF